MEKSKINQLSRYDKIELQKLVKSWGEKGDSDSVIEARMVAFAERRIRATSFTHIDNSSGHSRRVSENAREHIVHAKRKNYGPNWRANITPSMLIAKKLNSELLDELAPNERKNWVPIPVRLRSHNSMHIDLTDVSFHTHPNQTLASLGEIVKAESTCLSATIDFNDHLCHDIGAFLVLAAMRKDMAPIFDGGNISNGLAKVFNALGLDQPLNMAVEPLWEGDKDIWAFPLRSRRAAGTSKSPTRYIDPQTIEKVGPELCDAISKWLSKTVKQSLSFHGRRVVMKIVGETLENAERHSRPDTDSDGSWLISGFMTKRNNGSEDYFICQLGFLSIGSSISDTISSCDESTYSKMNSYVQKHKGAFSGYKYAEDHLKTIYALQDGVTRDHLAEKIGNGGTGFQTIIDFFADLAGIEGVEADAQMSIVSGRTCIKLKYPYFKGTSDTDESLRRLWFNGENSPDVAPSKKHIVELDQRFHGTLISMSMTLNEAYLIRTANGSN